MRRANGRRVAQDRSWSDEIVARPSASRAPRTRCLSALARVAPEVAAVAARHALEEQLELELLEMISEVGPRRGDWVGSIGRRPVHARLSDKARRARARGAGRRRPASRCSRRRQPRGTFWRSAFMALAVSAMIGRSRKPVLIPNGAHDLVAVHLGHHDVREDDVDGLAKGALLERREAVAAVLGVGHDHVLALERARDREMLRRSSSTTSTRRPASTGSLWWSCWSRRRLGSAIVSSTRCRKSAVSSSRRSGDLDVLDDDRLGEPPQLGLLVAR